MICNTWDNWYMDCVCVPFRGWMGETKHLSTFERVMVVSARHTSLSVSCSRVSCVYSIKNGPPPKGIGCFSIHHTCQCYTSLSVVKGDSARAVFVRSWEVSKIGILKSSVAPTSYGKLRLQRAQWRSQFCSTTPTYHIGTCLKSVQPSVQTACSVRRVWAAVTLV